MKPFPSFFMLIFSWILVFNQLSNKMFGPPQTTHEKIFRLPQTTSPQSSLRLCSGQQLPREHHYCPFPGQQAKPKISIKQLLKKRSLNTQSCTSILQVSERNTSEDPRITPLPTQRAFVSPVRPIYPPAEQMQTVQNNSAFNYIIGECVIRPQQIRIIYQNSPRAKIEQPSGTNQPQFYFAPTNKNHPVKHSQKIDTPLLLHQPLFLAQKPASSSKKDEEGIQKQREKEKTQAFNQFMSFGPKHFDLFKNMQTLQINQITSQIVEETERTDLATLDQNDHKRLTKTYSEARMRNERGRQAGSQLEGRLQFASSNIFSRIKKAETMGGREDSDHESQVVEKFESLMQKVRENRLDNSFIDI